MQNTKVQVKTKGNTSTQANTQAQVEISKGAMFVITSVPTLVGVWAAACFVGGLVASGGPVSMTKSFFTAVSGL